jgi:hypothetical protein
VFCLRDSMLNENAYEIFHTLVQFSFLKIQHWNFL